jgi:hypothetical protein
MGKRRDRGGMERGWEELSEGWASFREVYPFPLDSTEDSLRQLLVVLSLESDAHVHCQETRRVTNLATVVSAAREEWVRGRRRHTRVRTREATDEEPMSISISKKRTPRV